MKTKITFKTFLASLIMMLMICKTFAQWTSVSNGLPALTTVGVANVRDTLFTAVKNHGIYYSVNNGDNWTAWKNNSRLTSKNFNKMEGLPIFSTSAGGNYFYVYGENQMDFYFSQGDGSALVNYNNPSGIINSWMKIEDENTEYDVVATNNGIYYSTDDKKTWTQSSGISGDALVVNDLNLITYKDNSEAIFASTNKGIYKSEDFGKTFTLFTTGITENIVVYNQNFIVTTSSGIYFHRNDDDKYFPLILTGNYRTSVMSYTDLTAYAFGNGTAKKINLQTAAVENLNLTNVSGGIINSATYIKEFLFICTDNGGVFRINRQTGLSVNDSKLNSISFTAFPNPSDGKLTLTTNQPATFELYSVKGKLIKSLQVNKQESYHLKLASGIYFLRKKGTKIIKKIIFN
ncbi:T9SS type A sorting domain-containing protein [Polaribacter aquimarinus]|uniref:Secretion system C-terminal sorting domain-containing protein n=1 Tax=Polaribacter aquimarinus TaxID=2100726 RepID=A0A2U2J802_9FLAO|nr:T9SS type A sorting domain-containing protein [Polaribacter aquimarinus]PWG04470.1 hypothetical protein DIS07_13785 [Polaribacter aquimarinus]